MYQATCHSTGETVAIKKVLQDRRYKNRELQIMKIVKHPNIVEVKDCFYSKARNKDVNLNLVMEYIPETVYQAIRTHARSRICMPYLHSKLFAYQITRAIAYCHRMGICHRDIKPQNLLLDPKNQVVKLCDFGSAKILQKDQPNVAYICSRYYRAPELIFESSSYTCTIDVWSEGCVIAECFLASPLFQGGSAVDQLVEIIKVLGAPTKEQIIAMNPSYNQFIFPTVSPLTWKEVFAKTRDKEGNPMPPEGIDLIKRFLIYNPTRRLDPFDALAHPFFNELRNPKTRLKDGVHLPPLFNFTNEELKLIKERKLDVFPREN